MKHYEINYEYEGKQYTTTEQSNHDKKDEFYKRVLNRIESIVSAGAIITNVIEIEYR